MVNYDEQKSRQFEQATRTLAAVFGVALEAPEDHPFMQGGYMPLNPCVCVIEPCDCDGYEHGNTVMWLPRVGIVEERATGRRTAAGEAVVEYRLVKDTSVLLETLRSVSAGEAMAALGLAAADEPSSAPERPTGGGP
ncbi:hypothetical protein CLV35_0346 [Motilibacter peucedani]|uniref:Uncharacterized protein n=1 Tax=Motilibacter peucedani TaxID=598650 RepID=A0A420XT33_9ACTN|nr:hypothetical protein [Motilibacter peucedani]RKS79930.1 hypothetical protein CLV35_0346 [Motilibacter peucedani]